MKIDQIDGGRFQQVLNESPSEPGELAGMLSSPDLAGLTGAALFSHDLRYRYALVREWDSTRQKLCVIGLNPSTAGHTVNDPTITRLTRRAISLGMGGLVMLNLFAWRATDPSAMKAVEDPIGPANDLTLRVMTTGRMIVLAAWGNDGVTRGRAAAVVEKLLAANVTLHALAITQAGQPQHPLYVSYSAAPKIWRRPANIAYPESTTKTEF